MQTDEVSATGESTRQISVVLSPVKIRQLDEWRDDAHPTRSSVIADLVERRVEAEGKTLP